MNKTLPNKSNILSTLAIEGTSAIILSDNVKSSTVLTDMRNEHPRFATCVVCAPAGDYPFEKSYFDSVVVLNAKTNTLEGIRNGHLLKGVAKKGGKFYLVK